MDVQTSLSVIIGILIVYILVIDVFTTFFRISGMTQPKARFQVISLLTNCGFTTSESELVAAALSRRKLAMVAMIFGNVFSITIISIFVNVIVALPKTVINEIWYVLILMIGVFIVFVVLRRLPKTREYFSNKLDDFVKKILFRGITNPIAVIEDYDSNVVAEVTLTTVPEALSGKCITESDGVSLIMIYRDGNKLSDLNGTALQPKDRILLYGDLKTISQLFHCKNKASNIVMN